MGLSGRAELCGGAVRGWGPAIPAARTRARGSRPAESPGSASRPSAHHGSPRSPRAGSPVRLGVGRFHHATRLPPIHFFPPPCRSSIPTHRSYRRSDGGRNWFRGPNIGRDEGRLHGRMGRMRHCRMRHVAGLSAISRGQWRTSLVERGRLPGHKDFAPARRTGRGRPLISPYQVRVSQSSPGSRSVKPSYELGAVGVPVAVPAVPSPALLCPRTATVYPRPLIRLAISMPDSE